MVMAGASRGKSGEILKIDRKHDRAYVKGVNLGVKHIKKSFNGPGQKVEIERPIHLSNLMILDPKDNKPTRITYKVLESGKKERIAVKSKESLS